MQASQPLHILYSSVPLVCCPAALELVVKGILISLNWDLGLLARGCMRPSLGGLWRIHPLFSAHPGPGRVFLPSALNPIGCVLEFIVRGSVFNVPVWLLYGPRLIRLCKSAKSKRKRRRPRKTGGEICCLSGKFRRLNRGLKAAIGGVWGGEAPPA